MMTQSVLVSYLTDDLGLESTDVGDSTELFSTGLLDSFAVADLLMFLEEQGGFEVEPEEVVLENFDTIERIMNFMRSKTAA